MPFKTIKQQIFV